MVQVSANPFGDFRLECRRLLEKAFIEEFAGQEIPNIGLDLPPSPQFGELSSSLCFDLARRLGADPMKVAELLAKGVEHSLASTGSSLVRAVKAEGGGYINFYANFSRLADLTLNSVRALGDEYGYVRTDQPLRVIVEHTSANPIHPLHIGHGRNSLLGDSLARILEARGHRVSKHFYIDDMGRQSAIIALGYKMLGQPKPEGKADHFIGAIYSISSCLLEIRRLKGEIEKAKSLQASDEKILELQRRMDDWISAAAQLKERFPKLFEDLLGKITAAENPELEVNLLLREYEACKDYARNLIRSISTLCLQGFKETLSRVDILIDSWDWESDFVWSGNVSRYFDALKRTPYVGFDGSVFEFYADAVVQSFGLREELGLKKNYEVPSLTLGRSDGTTLYTTRDIAYTIWKFGRADWVINVIGMEQSLAQLQLKLALYALGRVDEARRLTHFSYNLVTFPGQRISARRGRFLSFDEVIDEAVERAYVEVSKRSPDLSEGNKREIAEAVGIGAVKYALVGTDPQKPVTFTWDRVLDFERNSGPYIQYSHARACSILRRARFLAEEADFNLLNEPVERDLVLLISRFPDVFIDAAENLKPHAIADFANTLADKFNTFYAYLPVIRAEPSELRSARLMLVEAVKTVLKNALSLLGIKAPERM
ncbi:MAG: arginine--tRNA ligase [Nitrososphaerota archaeon]|nr:arginine--tRNA ligase [Candidatus Bathyarchaeota archaeon]MDW8048191.1 arginine--tRNA ligase [Nitrososphaerota archaeon]